MKSILNSWNKIGLVPQIILGLIVGILLGMLFPQKLALVSVLGQLFVGALKAVAPILVSLLVMSAIAQHQAGKKTNMKKIVVLYLVGTLAASVVAVMASFIFKIQLILPQAGQQSATKPPGGITEVILTLLGNVVDNPIKALATGNYIGILAAAIILGIALRHSKKETKNLIADLSEAVSQVVRWVIKMAPLGVLGLVFNTVATTGMEGMKKYVHIILLLVGTMLVVAFVVNPIIVFFVTRKNPYPLVITCVKESGIYAFFTRSSAANIPVNMGLCERLGLDKDTYSISIPLGATINMGGAAITIAILSLAATHTLGISVDIPTALILCLLSAISACGASGVAGGSLLLIPLACSLFGIPDSIAYQVVGVGFIVGVIQDSCETALNSSTDVLFTAAAELGERRKSGNCEMFEEDDDYDEEDEEEFDGAYEAAGMEEIKEDETQKIDVE